MSIRAMVRIDRTLLNPRQVDVIKEDLLLRQKGGKKYGFGPGQDVRLYKEVANWIEVPRQYAMFELPSILSQVDDETVEGDPINITFTKPLRDYQEPLVEDFLSKLGQGKARYGGIFSAKCGCHAKGERILMADGTAKRAEDVVVGDLLMGIDGPRRVKELHRGRQRMAKVIPNKGEPFIVNIGHILTVVWSVSQGQYKDGDVIDISVAEWLASTKTFQRHTVLYRPRVDEFFTDYTPQDKPIDPYHLGLLLGDGTLSKSVGITTTDPEIVLETRMLAGRFGLNVRKEDSGGSRTPTYLINTGKKFSGKNTLVAALKSLDLFGSKSGDKFIPHSYLTASRSERFELLAGLIDTDGSKDRKCYDYVTKSKQLAEDIEFLCRSLGLAAYKKPKKINGQIYWRLCISGECSRIPVRVPRKKVRQRTINKSVQRVGFKVELLPEDDYYGFVVDEDHRYLMADFTWTHNTGKTVMALKFVEQLDRPAIVLVHANFLMTQWRKAIKFFTNIDSDEIGLVQQDKCDWENKKIVLAMVESLVGEREYPKEMFEHFGVLIADEVHRHGAAQWSKAIAMFPAKIRIGLSATPRRGDGLWDVLRWHVGDVLTQSQKGGDANVFTVPTGIALTEDTYRTRNAEINLGRLITVLTKIGSRNDLIVDHILKAVAAGRRVLVLSERLKHLDTLKAMVELLWDGSPSALRIGRYVGGMKDSEIEHSQTCNLLFGTVQYAKEGLDDPSLDTLMLTTPKSDVEQAAGRILRRDADKKPPFIIDFLDDKTGPCIGFYKRRRKQYEQLGFTVKELASKR